MIVQDLRKSICLYLGYDPGEDVRLYANSKECGIEEWNVQEKKPTIEQLEKIYSDNEIELIREEKLNQIKAECNQEINKLFDHNQELKYNRETNAINSEYSITGKMSEEQKSRLYWIRENVFIPIEIIANKSNKFETELNKLKTLKSVKNYTWNYDE